MYIIWGCMLDDMWACMVWCDTYIEIYICI